MDSDGENVQRLTNDGSIALSPAWSPDGQRMAYTSFRTGSPLLYERDLRTGRDRVISDRDGREHHARLLARRADDRLRDLGRPGTPRSRRTTASAAAA